MKKIGLLFFILLSILANAQQSKQDTLRSLYTKEFLVNPLAFFVGGFEIGYSRIYEQTKNVRVIGGYYYSEGANSYNNRISSKEFKNMEGFRLEGQYLFLKPVNGGQRYYAGGFLTYKQISMQMKDNTQTNNGPWQNLHASAMSFGLLLGLRGYVADNFFFDLYVGGGPNIPIDGTNSDDVNLNIVNPYKRSINPRAGLIIGVAF